MLILCLSSHNFTGRKECVHVSTVGVVAFIVIIGRVMSEKRQNTEMETKISD